MQAVSVSRDLAEKFERIMRDGREQWSLSQNAAPTREIKLDFLLNAYKAFAQAWAVADVAALLAPANQYARWSDRRQQAGVHLITVRAETNTVQRLEVTA